MNFEGAQRINAIMQRMEQIQSRFTPPPPITAYPGAGTAGSSFEMALKQAMASPGSTTAMNGMQQYPYTASSFMPPFMNGPLGNGSWVDQVAAQDPGKIISYQDFQMQAQTASRFTRLESLIRQTFPGRGIYITSTMDGQHMDPNHPAGKALDFVVDGLTKDESVTLERLCQQAGFTPYNEYLHDSPYKTGDHMHVDLA